MSVDETDTPTRRSFYQQRVGVLGKVLTLVWLVGNIAATLFYLAIGRWRELSTLGQTLSWFALLICFAMWMICRRGTHSRRFVSAVESVSMMGSAVAVSLMGRYITPQALSINAELDGLDLEALEPEALAVMSGQQLEQFLVVLMFGLAFGYAIHPEDGGDAVTLLEKAAAPRIRML